MSAISGRPSRRTAAAQKKILIDEDSEDEIAAIKNENEDGDEFTPAPQSSPRRQSRRKTVEPSPTKRRTRKTEEPILENSTVFDPDTSVRPEPASPTKRGSPRKRKSAPAPRKSRAGAAPEDDSAPPVPAIEKQSAPLSDITEAAINGRPPSSGSQKEFVAVKAMDTVLEKPMDIVIRSRALAAPPVQEDTGPKKRTVIKHLVLNNFKSYAGRQDVGPFHASFSSVVGPNGSGKSNVIDSLLFVFGFRASKMRQGKISALIHNSAAFPDLDHCEVEVHFQEVMDLAGGGHDVIPDSTLIISRKAFKNNASKYYINMKESNFTEVTTLLKERGVDLDHKRFLILQGEVESIAQMKPKAANEHDDGLLEYLEDIIGTSKYKSPIEESAAEVDTLNEVCAEKSSRVQHIEREKNGLEDKKNKALEYIKNENELALKQSALYQIYIDECGDNLKVTDEAIGQMQEQLSTELEKHQGSEEGIKSLEKAHKQGSKEYEKMQKATQEVLKEMAKYDKENVKHDEKKKFLTTKQTKLEKALNTSRLAISEAVSLIQRSNDDVDRNSKEIAKLESETEKEEKELSSIRDALKGKTQAFSDQITAKQRSLEPWNAKINEKQSAIAVTESELNILRERASAGAVALEAGHEKIKSLAENRKSKQSEAKELSSQKGKLEKEAKNFETELAKLAQSEADVRSKLSGARQKADEARASLSSTKSQGDVLKGLNRLKESGRIDGFHGRLGNLGTIDQKYDVAISTACPSLDNLVVDTVEVGQQCIDYLRKNNLGRANIICLDRLARRDLSLIETPENVPRLFDLIKTKNDIFKPAFYSVLQNTLVAKDLKQANAIAYGARRWRVVTLDGQLIDVSGTMSGGGTRVAKGGMSSKLVADTTKEQVAKLEVDRDQLEEELKIIQEQQGTIEASLQAITSRIPKVETSIQKTSLEIQSIEKNLADAELRVRELSAEQPASNADDAQIKKLEKQIAQLEKEASKLRGESAGLEQEIQSLQEKIMEVGGVKLRTQKAKVDGLKEQVDTLTEEMSNAEVARSKAEKQQTKHQKTHADTEKELAGVAKDLERLGHEVQNQHDDASGYKQRAEEAQEVRFQYIDTLSAAFTDIDFRRHSIPNRRSSQPSSVNSRLRQPTLTKPVPSRSKCATSLRRIRKSRPRIRSVSSIGMKS